MTGQMSALDLDHAVEMLRAHCDNPSGFLALNHGNRRYTAPGVDGVVFYREAGRCWIQFGGPIAAAADRPELLRRFREAARRRGRRVLAVQVPESDAPLYAGQGFTVNQFGMSYAVDLAGFTLRGKKFVKLRNKIARAKRLGVTPAEVDPAGHADALDRIDGRWLRSKGRFAREMAFMIGEVGGPAQPLRRLFVATMADEPIAYISYSPVYGPRPGWLHDLSRRVPGPTPGVMELTNLFALERFRDEGSPWLHFGFTPFTGLGPEHRMPTASKPVDAAMRLLAEKGDAIYPAHGQLDYKLKWDPGYRTPDYLAFDGRLTPSLAWNLLRVTNLIPNSLRA
jgi:lysylphosphatidylglycerol synthetase-like protein (DUF2156 family)